MAQGQRLRVDPSLFLFRVMTRLKRSLLSWAGIAAFAIGAQVYSARGLISGEPPLVPGTMLDGRSFDLNTLRGEPAAIYFWASWCPVCKSMQGTIDSVAQDHPLIGVALQSGNADEVARHLKESSFGLNTLIDEDGTVGKRYGLRGVPTLFILDGQGQIRFATSGYTSEPGLRLRLWLAGF